MNKYCYDIEIFRNLFTITFIPEDISENDLKNYIKWDKEFLKYEANINSKYSLDEIKNNKKSIIEKTGIKQFVIYYHPNKEFCKNDSRLLTLFFHSFKHLTGYNSNMYDKNILDILLYNSKYLDEFGYHKKENKHITDILFDKSQDIISFGAGYDKLIDFKKYYKSPYRDYDIQKILYLDKSMTSLKQVSICLKWHRVQDLPIHFSENVAPSQIETVLDYNLNDVLITLLLKRNQYKEVNLRKLISDQFKVDVLNNSRSSIADRIFANYYSDKTGLAYKDYKDLRTERNRIKIFDILHNNFTFETNILKQFLYDLENKTIIVGGKDFLYNLTIKDKQFTFAKGGLHSVDDANKFTTENSKYIIIDCDVTSMYPSAILNWKIAPKHLDKKAFLEILKQLVDTRVEAKGLAKNINKILKNYKKGDIKLNKNEIDKLNDAFTIYDSKQEAMKIVINAIYGKFGSRDSILFDLQCLYETTINLQLCLIKLAEMLILKDFNVLSANTDGIVCKFEKNKFDEYSSICKEWENLTKLSLEYTEYEEYIRRDVNSYIAVKSGFREFIKNNKSDYKDYIKTKGIFTTDISFNKGYFAPIIFIALNEYFLFGTDYREYIRNHINTSDEAIYDYCIAQKTGSQFNMIFREIINRKYVESKLTKTNRYYVSNTGGQIIKSYKDKQKEISVLVGYNVKPFNNYIKKDNYDIDFSFYINEITKLLEKKIENKQQILF